MKSKLQSKRQEGFTIIEVLIVLAIAGLIILIVFLAVPALQRNSRNTQYKNQMAGYLGAVNEWSNNNNGKVPSTTGDMTAINDLAADGPITEYTAVPKTGAQNGALAVGAMEVVTGAKCDTAANKIGETLASSSRSIAIRYTVENSSGAAVGQCTGS